MFGTVYCISFKKKKTIQSHDTVERYKYKN